MEQINKGREEYFDTIAEKLCQLVKAEYLTNSRLVQAMGEEPDPQRKLFLLQIQKKEISLDELITNRPHQLAKFASKYQLVVDKVSKKKARRPRRKIVLED
ncbi:MAG: hypothetical protein IPN95_24920 [Bacteroidetes bacterium]|nr:hypothetical protein [Bacteroidota bacterium]